MPSRPRLSPLLGLATLLCLPMNSSLAGTVTVFDFTAHNATHKTWQIVNDGVMGGVSRSRFQVKSGGPAVFSGEVSLENNGGFASVRSPEGSVSLADGEAFLLRVKGDGGQYKFTARTNERLDGATYQVPFRPRKNEWSEVRIPLAGLRASYRGRSLPDLPPPAASAIRSIGFLISDQQAGPFRLEIEWIKAERSEVLPP